MIDIDRYFAILNALSPRLSKCPEVTKYPDREGPEAEAVAVDLSDIEGSLRVFLDEQLPILIQRAEQPPDVYDALQDIREELRHVLYHIMDSPFYGYLHRGIDWQKVKHSTAEASAPLDTAAIPYLLGEAAAVEKLSSKLSTCPQVSNYDEGEEREAQNLARSLSELEAASHKFVDDQLPSLIKAESSIVCDLLLEIGEELRRILHAIGGSAFFRLLFISYADSNQRGRVGSKGPSE